MTVLNWRGGKCGFEMVVFKGAVRFALRDVGRSFRGVQRVCFIERFKDSRFKDSRGCVGYNEFALLKALLLGAKLSPRKVGG